MSSSESISDTQELLPPSSSGYTAMAIKHPPTPRKPNQTRHNPWQRKEVERGWCKLLPHQARVHVKETGPSQPTPSPPCEMVVSLIMIISCFIVGTPLSLLCTIPAYTLADKAWVYRMRGEPMRARRYTRWSYVLNCIALLYGILCIATFLIVYVHMMSPDGL